MDAYNSERNAAASSHTHHLATKDPDVDGSGSGGERREERHNRFDSGGTLSEAGPFVCSAGPQGGEQQTCKSTRKHIKLSHLHFASSRPVF